MAAIVPDSPAILCIYPTDLGSELSPGTHIGMDTSVNVVKFVQISNRFLESATITAKTEALAQLVFATLDANPLIRPHLDHQALQGRKIHLNPYGLDTAFSTQCKNALARTIEVYQKVHGQTAIKIAYKSHDMGVPGTDQIASKGMNSQAFCFTTSTPEIAKIIYKRFTTDPNVSNRIMPPMITETVLVVLPNGYRTRFTQEDEDVLTQLASTIPLPALSAATSNDHKHAAPISSGAAAADEVMGVASSLEALSLFQYPSDNEASADRAD